MYAISIRIKQYVKESVKKFKFMLDHMKIINIIIFVEIYWVKKKLYLLKWRKYQSNEFNLNVKVESYQYPFDGTSLVPNDSIGP